MTTRALSRTVNGGRAAASFVSVAEFEGEFGEAARDAISAGATGFAYALGDVEMGFCRLERTIVELDLTTVWTAGGEISDGVFVLKIKNNAARTAMMPMIVQNVFITR